MTDVGVEELMLALEKHKETVEYVSFQEHPISGIPNISIFSNLKILTIDNTSTECFDNVVYFLPKSLEKFFASGSVTPYGLEVLAERIQGGELNDTISYS